MQNINGPNLCNEAKLRVLSIKYNIIETKILTDAEKGQIVYILRKSMIVNEYLFEFKRVKFPNNLCFTISINKVQGHNGSCRNRQYRTFHYTRGQYYVACSRVISEKTYLYMPLNKKLIILFIEKF